jgi:hypothetical protein
MKLARNALLVTFALVAGIATTAVAADKGKAEAKLKAALGAQDAEKVREACDELIDVGGKDALNVILNVIASPQLPDQLYWQLIGGASGFHDEPALMELAKQVVAHQNDKGARGSLSRDLLFGLQNNNAPERAKAVGSILKTGIYDLQLLAVDQLAQLRSVDSVDALVECYKKEGTKGDPELRHRLINALKTLTDQTFQDPADWAKYWEGQRAQGVPAPKAAGGGGGSGGTMEKPRDKEFGGTVEKMPPKHVIVLANVGDAPGDEKPEQDDIDYDTMQTVLTQFKIPHIVVKRKTFEADPGKFLKDAYAVLINCHQMNEHCVCPNCKPPEGDLTNRMMHCNHKCNVHKNVTYALKQDTLNAIKDWVENQGGFLYTEDWGLVETVQKLWPDKVECGSTGSGEKKTLKLVRKQKEDKSGWYPHIPCKLVPAKGNTSHPLMRGVWEKPKKAEAPKKEEPGEAGGTRARENSPAKPLEHMWTVDDESPAIDIKDPNSVIALLEAPDLVKIGDGFSQVVAVTFRAGKAKPQPKKQATGPDSDEGKVKGTGEWATNSAGGRVLHTMSHYGHQGGGTDDGQCLFNLIVNFLLEAAKRHDGSTD